MRNKREKVAHSFLVLGFLALAKQLSFVLRPFLGYTSIIVLPIVGFALFMYVVFSDLDMMQRKILVSLIVSITVVFLVFSLSFEVKQPPADPIKYLFPPVNFLMTGLASISAGIAIKYYKVIKIIRLAT